MRYIVNDSGYLLDVSFGATIVCGGQDCTAYSGSVPDGYDSLYDWYCQESDKLYRWMIVDGELTLDETAAEPEVEWENPPLIVGVEYRTTKRWCGKPVYTKAVNCGDMPQSSGKSVAHGSSGCKIIGCTGTTGSGIGLPYVSASGGRLWISANEVNIVLYSNYDSTAEDVVAVIEYVKS